MKQIHKYQLSRTLLFLGGILLFSTLTSAQQAKVTRIFEESFEDFPRKEKNLRKWDAPVVADLDQDGYPDLVLNDHGLGISVCWNNKGKFAKPYDVIMGDLHGVSIGDFDFDGNNEMILSRGGGSGSNARNSKILRITKQREFIPLPDFKVPLEMMRGRTLKFYDGDNDGDLDLVNFAFPSKEKNGKSENYIYKNDAQGQLILADTLPATKADGQKTLITDFNGDHVLDILLYGNGKVKIYQGNGDLTYGEMDKVFPYAMEDVTAIAELDFDNDGDFDLILTRGKEFEIGETFLNKESQTWGFFTKRGDFQFDDLVLGDVLNMYNFQSQWPFNDAYYIGESAYQYDFAGETHSGKNMRLVNSNALGFPDKLNEKGGIHIGFVGNDSWRIAGSTWSPTTGTVKGVTDYPEYDHPKGLLDVLLENKNGKFVDITKNANLHASEHTVGVSVADFDNNGLQDILIIRRGEMVFDNETILYANKGNATFQRVEHSGLVTSDVGAMGMAIEVLDYDFDGKVDVVIGNERGKWHLFKNSMPDASKNSFLTVAVERAPSGKATALGALVSIDGCTGKQLKRIGTTGSAYSLSFNPYVHFGLGDCKKSVKIKVVWSNGETATRTVKDFNKKVTIGTNGNL